MSRMDGEGANAPGHACTVFQSNAGPGGVLRALMAVVAVGALGGCASTQSVVSGDNQPMFPESKWGVSASRRVAGEDDRIQKGGGVYKVGAPYQVGGRWYNPREQPEYDRVGTASWYGSDFHGRHTANREVFDMHALTAAHPTLPLPSYAYVTNLSNNRTILVRINDRGPYVGNRMIDLSRESARALGLLSGGTGQVRVRYAGPAPLDGNDSRERQFLASRPWKGGRDIAALERAQSAQEYAAYRSTAPEQSLDWTPPARPSRTGATERPQAMPVAGQSLRQSYADAGPSQGGEAWSPDRYRAALAAR